MRSLFSYLLFCVSLLLVGGCTQKQADNQKLLVSLPEVTSSLTTKDGLWMIDYAFDGDKLGYAVISGPSAGEVHGHSGMGGDSAGKLWATVNMPDGTKISVWGSGRIFFFSGTNVTECPQSILGKTFRAFLDSKPSDYSMAALLAFAEEHK
jgi:hypothetical protein